MKQEREIISQSEAARRWIQANGNKGCSRQRINELVLQGRFTTPVDGFGVEHKGKVYADELVGFKMWASGRPRLDAASDNGKI